MAVMMPRERWTDDRLDDLNQKVDDGFKKVDKRFDMAREEMKNEVGGLRVELMALHRLLLRASIGGGVAVAALLLGSLTGHM